MSKIDKMAAKDAYAWASAEMFFGPGAGTRRKLLDADIAHKIRTLPGYFEKFQAEYDKQDFAKHAIKAAKERKRVDRAAALNKNTRALIRGDRRGMSTGLGIIFVAAVVAHQTGYDEVILAKGRMEYLKLKAKAKKFKQDHQL